MDADPDRYNEGMTDQDFHSDPDFGISCLDLPYLNQENLVYKD